MNYFGACGGSNGLGKKIESCAVLIGWEIVGSGSCQFLSFNRSEGI